MFILSHINYYYNRKNITEILNSNNMIKVSQQHTPLHREPNCLHHYFVVTWSASFVVSELWIFARMQEWIGFGCVWMNPPSKKELNHIHWRRHSFKNKQKISHKVCSKGVSRELFKTSELVSDCEHLQELYEVMFNQYWPNLPHIKFKARSPALFIALSSKQTFCGKHKTGQKVENIENAIFYFHVETVFNFFM